MFQKGLHEKILKVGRLVELHKQLLRTRVWGTRRKETRAVPACAELTIDCERNHEHVMWELWLHRYTGSRSLGAGRGASGLVLWFGKEDRRQGCHRAGTLALKTYLLKQPALRKWKEHRGPGNGWGQPIKIMDPTMREKEEPALNDQAREGVGSLYSQDPLEPPSAKLHKAQHRLASRKKLGN